MRTGTENATTDCFSVPTYRNDQHGQFIQYEAVKRKVEQFRRRYQGNVLLLNGGDISYREAAWQSYYPKIADVTEYEANLNDMIAKMNDIGFDAMAPGNHDLYYVSNVTVRCLQKAEFPIICANIEVTTPNMVQMEPSILRTMPNGIRARVTGMTYAPSFPTIRCRASPMPP